MNHLLVSNELRKKLNQVNIKLIMCITFLFTNPGDSSIKYKLILINNRDEFYGRKTQSATLSKVGESEPFGSNKLTIYSTDLGGVVKGKEK